MKTKLIILLLCLSNLLFAQSGTHSSELYSDSLNIIKEDIYLEITDFVSKSIKGYCVLTVNPKTSTLNHISLDLLKLNIDSVVYNNHSLNFNYNDTVLNINLLNSLTTSDTAIIKVYYYGVPIIDPSNWGGFYFSVGTAFNLGVGFEDNPHCFGRVWYPCIDDFRTKSLYSFHIKTLTPKMAVCNGNLDSISDLGNGYKIWHWNMKNIIPSYLASVAVSEYALYSDVYNGISASIPIQIYVRPQDTAKVRASFINLKNILSIFENNFGPYLWQRVGYVGVPFDGGAMEHATSIAYPNACIDGTLNYENLYAHELAHHWFGDLITCSKASEMWINEGWAEFCEIYYSKILYGNNYFKDLKRKQQKNVLQFAHIEDGGNYFALGNVPHQYTYGATVYHKGSIVINTLRNQMGDYKFFETVKALLQTYKYGNITNEEFKNFFTIHSGINLDNFFSSWVLKPGFVHYGSDSFSVNPIGNNFLVNVFIHQRLKGCTDYYAGDKIDISFMDNSWRRYDTTFVINSTFQNVNITLPFSPDFIMIDPEEKLSDATTDKYIVATNTGTYSFSEELFTLEISEITDSAFVRVTHNWVAPENNFVNNQGIKRISNFRYWSIEGILPQGLNATGRFYYNSTKPYTISSSSNAWLDHTLMPVLLSGDSLVLLYRKNASEKWGIVNFKKLGTLNSGYLTTTELKTGDYTLGIGQPRTSSINDNGSGKIKIFPNPARDIINIYLPTDEECTIELYDIKGSSVYRQKHNTQNIAISCANYKKGTYKIKLSSIEGVFGDSIVIE